MKKLNIQIITPPVASEGIDMDLVNLTEYLVKHGHDDGSGGGYGLGGEFGYGVEFENDTFMMHRFCWCEKDTCEWCFRNDNTNLGKAMRTILLHKYNNKKWSEWGYAPNFFYKPSKLLIRWYKWLGRDTEISRKLKKGEWENILKDCYNSLKPYRKEKK